MALRFEDPPVYRSSALAPYLDDLAELKQHPKRWAVIATFPAHPASDNGDGKAANVAQAIRQAKSPVCQPKGSFEVKQRRVDDEHRVYVRYLGEQEASQ